MTAPDYVAQVAELLREHQARGFAFDDECRCGWPIPDANGWSNQAAHRTHQAEVLAAAGLIPTSTEWGVRYEVDRDRSLDETRASEDDARHDVEASPTDSALISRAVTDWKDATDD